MVEKRASLQTTEVMGSKPSIFPYRIMAPTAERKKGSVMTFSSLVRSIFLVVMFSPVPRKNSVQPEIIGKRVQIIFLQQIL